MDVSQLQRRMDMEHRDNIVRFQSIKQKRDAMEERLQRLEGVWNELCILSARVQTLEKLVEELSSPKKAKK